MTKETYDYDMDPSPETIQGAIQWFNLRQKAIADAIEQTPHEGYVPVVAFGPSGQIMLTFETDNANA